MTDTIRLPVEITDGSNRPSKGFRNMVNDIRAAVADTCFVIENRTDEPDSPVDGRIWLIVSGSNPMYDPFSILEDRTSDPSNPVTGRIWLRTDL